MKELLAREAAIDTPSLKIGGLIFGSLKRIGGYQVFAYNLFTRLARRGHHLTLYLAREEYIENRGFYASLPFTVRPLFFKSYTLAHRFPALLRSYLRYQNGRHRYQVWQIIGAYPAGWLASTLAGVTPLVLRTHGDDVQKDAELAYGLRLDPRLEESIQNTLHRMDQVVALTDTISQCYRELGVPARKIVEIPNGVDTRRFAEPHDGQRTRQQWSLPSDRPLLLTVGRYHPKKGYALIPEVARRLRERGLSFCWLIVGSNTQALQPLIEEAGVGDVVRTEGEIGVPESPDAQGHLAVPHEKLVRLYQCADIFAFPSWLEGFPRVIIEAMAAGLAVVSTSAPGCRDVMVHGRNGLLARPGDVEELTAHLQALLENPGRRQELAQNATRDCQIYDWDAVVDRYVQLYRSLL